MEISKLFENNDIIADVTVLAYNVEDAKLHYKLQITFTDDSLLFAKEYISATERKYAFHWQDSSGKMLARWDNSPHHKNLPTFPHHKHIADNIQACKEPEMNDVLNEIRNQIASDRKV
jgi:hypothetical protein